MTETKTFVFTLSNGSLKFSGKDQLEAWVKLSMWLDNLVKNANEGNFTVGTAMYDVFDVNEDKK